MEEKLLHQLRSLGHMMQHSVDMKGGQGRLLAMLLRLGDTPQRELQQMLHIAPGSLSELLAKLEANHLIVRMPNEQDRRNVDIKLTHQGIEAANKIAAERQAMQSTLFNVLSDEEKQALSNLLEKLNTDWLSRYGKPEPRHPHGHHPEVRP